ncbi:MAG TPA: hypothetical protein VE975_05450 [Actinomycetota bacterium]|jgi:hypothetical protein|nr:hypothetical protein [Actinomycetota bacterium]
MREDHEDQERPRPRPRVVDKRVVSQGETGPPPAGETTTPAPEPARQQVAGAGAAGADEAAGPQFAGERPGAAPPTEPQLSAEDEAQAREMVQQMTEVPALDWVLNLAVTLANVAGAKLDRGQVQDSQIAIEALSGIIEKTGPRLGEAEQPLRQTLAQLQLAYAQRSAS